jgi:hypothetical protein
MLVGDIAAATNGRPALLPPVNSPNSTWSADSYWFVIVVPFDWSSKPSVTPVA